MSNLDKTPDMLDISEDEKHAQELIKDGQIDQAIAIYQNLDLQSPRILRMLGELYGRKKGDYDLAITYYDQALTIQEKTGEDISNTLSDLGFAYQNLRQFDVALVYHLRAFELRQKIPNIDSRIIVISLFGISVAYWSQHDLSEALKYAQQAFNLSQSLPTNNDINIATTLAMLGNIYHGCGDDIHALEVDKRALVLLEQAYSLDSPTLVPLLNNIGTIQISMGLWKDALITFVRVLHICEKHFPEGHPRRVTICNNIHRVVSMQEYNDWNSYSSLWRKVPKILLF